MQFLPGLSVGMAMPQHATGQIHSVFEHACNVELHNGDWLTLLCRSMPDAPSAIRLDIEAGFTRLFQSGEVFALKSGGWRTSRCRGDMSGLPVYTPAPHQPLCPDADIVRHLKAVDILREQHVGRNPMLALPHFVIESGKKMANAISNRNDKEIKHIATHLLGYGQGLTPCGDDVLVGLLAGLWRLSVIDSSYLALLNVLQSHLQNDLHRTTAVSQHYLRLALQGLFAKPLDQLCEYILSQSDETLLAYAANAALKIGASSGADGVFGLLLTYQANFTKRSIAFN